MKLPSLEKLKEKKGPKTINKIVVGVLTIALMGIASPSFSTENIDSLQQKNAKVERVISLLPDNGSGVLYAYHTSHRSHSSHSSHYSCTPGYTCYVGNS